MSGLIVAIDAGGSKTDAVALTIDGELVAHRRGPGSSPHLEGLADAVRVVDELVRAVARGERVEHASLFVSGLDLPVEIEQYADAITGFDWAGESTVVDNDLYALLRAGTDELDAVAIICGTGVNAIGVRADGADVRFPALGGISGDWGGGSGIGEQALWHAARDADGRGPHTMLSAVIVEQLGVESVPALIEDLHFGRRDSSELTALTPAVFEAARAGDAVAAGLVDRQAEELVAFARACVTRLGLERRSIPIVLGGGIVRSGDERLISGITAGLAQVAPEARIEILETAPIVGAALLALGNAGAAPEALERARAAVTQVSRADATREVQPASS
ncbi:N-acetylglucosamine kinase [Agromyces badenianii]|uniref:N-acetylglucosamine kinase n=1 Tax=Agromyces badenianii TaxID=2080742 RepID=A0A2S0WZX3_9MICO|nr:BadF/BadG/BcrA/BcrD ATPase family protein [Agromyces badenianii]AWB96919.1 N-acetylglucosamine kinase [Agromyces badenianii]PWC05840.1 N-acetylglucosamine kinase [Agromyces badenianii]